jgi:hypothetical protein
VLNILNHIRAARAIRIWIPDHLRLVAAHSVNANRNARAGFTDEDHIAAAAAWLERAQDVTKDNGVCGRYSLRGGWTSSYPETTGYIIPTFLKLADVMHKSSFTDRAEKCVRFLLPLQLASGAFPGSEVAENTTEPSSFNSAQIITGLLAWYRHSKQQKTLDAAIRAADWLVGVQDEDGAFRKHFYLGAPATYSSHASCWLAELGEFLGNERYLKAAERHLDWVLQNYDPSKRWFDLCGFSSEEHAQRVSVTHTIAYTIFGVLMTSEILGRKDGISAARAAAVAALQRSEILRRVPGFLNADWRPAEGHAKAACLTGNAQLASIWFRLFERDNDIRYVNAAIRALDEVKRAQPMRIQHPGIAGGIPGSAPFWGDYTKNAVPNWAAKFFIDAMLEKQEILRRLPDRRWEGAFVEMDRHVQGPEAGSERLPEPLRVVVYTRIGSTKPAEILARTRNWSFAPAAVLVESRPAPGLRARLQTKFRTDGLSGLFVTLRNRVRPVAEVMVAEGGSHPATDMYALFRDRGVPVHRVESVNSPVALNIISSLQPGLAVNLGAGILRQPLLDIPRLGTLNAHMGLLPYYRGMNVAEWSALNGDPVGCTVHFVDAGIDTGAIIATRPVDPRNASSIAQLRSLVDQAQLKLMSDVLQWIWRERRAPAVRPQCPDEGVQFFTMCAELRHFLEAKMVH